MADQAHSFARISSISSYDCTTRRTNDKELVGDIFGFVYFSSEAQSDGLFLGNEYLTNRYPQQFPYRDSKIKINS